MRLPWARGGQSPFVILRSWREPLRLNPVSRFARFGQETGLRANVRKLSVQDGGQQPGSLKNPAMTLAILSASRGA